MWKPTATIVLLCALPVLGGLTVASPATAAGLSPPVADCDAHGRLTHNYSTAQLQSALATMPADVAEYTNCPNVIRQALLAKLGKLKGSDGSGGGSFLPTWLLVVLALLVAAGAGFGVVAIRNRRGAT